MIGEGFDIDRPGGGDPGPQDPGRVAREAADRIAQQVRDVLQSAEERAAEIRSQAEADAEAIRRDAGGAAARMLGNVERLEDELEEHLTGVFDSVRREVQGLASPEEIEAAPQRTQEAGPAPAPDRARFEPLPAPPPGERGAPGSDPQAAAPPADPDEPRFEPLPESQRPPEAEAEADPPEASEEQPRRRRGLLRGRRSREEEQSVPIRDGDADDA